MKCIEGRSHEEGNRSVCVITPRPLRAEKKKKGPGQGPVWVTRTQMWTDLLAVGVDQDKIDCHPNAVLLELWWQQFRCGQKPPTERVRPVALKDFLKPQNALLTLYD